MQYVMVQVQHLTFEISRDVTTVATATAVAPQSFSHGYVPDQCDPSSFLQSDTKIINECCALSKMDEIKEI